MRLCRTCNKPVPNRHGPGRPTRYHLGCKIENRAAQNRYHQSRYRQRHFWTSEAVLELVACAGAEQDVGERLAAQLVPRLRGPFHSAGNLINWSIGDNNVVGYVHRHVDRDDTVAVLTAGPGCAARLWVAMQGLKLDILLVPRHWWLHVLGFWGVSQDFSRLRTDAGSEHSDHTCEMAKGFQPQLCCQACARSYSMELAAARQRFRISLRD